MKRRLQLIVMRYGTSHFQLPYMVCGAETNTLGTLTNVPKYKIASGKLYLPTSLIQNSNSAPSTSGISCDSEFACMIVVLQSAIEELLDKFERSVVP